MSIERVTYEIIDNKMLTLRQRVGIFVKYLQNRLVCWRESLVLFLWMAGIVLLTGYIVNWIINPTQYFLPDFIKIFRIFRGQKSLKIKQADLWSKIRNSQKGYFEGILHN